MKKRTTILLDAGLFRKTRRRAHEEGATLTAVVEDALRKSLSPRPRPGRRGKIRLTTVRGRLRPGVDLDDSAALRDLMDSGHVPS